MFWLKLEIRFLFQICSLISKSGSSHCLVFTYPSPPPLHTQYIYGRCNLKPKPNLRLLSQIDSCTWTCDNYTHYYTFKHGLMQKGGFQKKKCSKSVTLGVKIQTMNTLMKPMQFICGNIVFSEFSKILSHLHVSYFSEKIN